MKILDEKVELLVDNGELSVEFEVWSVEGSPVEGSIKLLVDDGELSVEFEVWSVEGLPVDGSISRWKHQSRDNRSREASVEG
ncbi:hypothetical protein Wxf_00031 [Armadillidium vulgare]|nr:hypothetical protein Wxf_00031 [Armadillidium vulgare] [Wolbachia endosymbiont of Armadillidium vulgare]